MAKIWTHDRLAYLREIAPGRSNVEVHRLVNERFNLNLTLKQILNAKQHYKIMSGLTGRFPKNHTPFNKGKKQTEYMTAEQIERTRPTRFKPGQKPPNYKPVGSERIDTKDGYIVVKTQNKGTWPERWRHKHRIVWEQANGPIPDGHIIIFLNGDKTDCRLENITMIPRKLHVRMNQNRLRFSDPDLTETGLNVAGLMAAVGDAKRRRSK